PGGPRGGLGRISASPRGPARVCPPGAPPPRRGRVSVLPLPAVINTRLSLLAAPRRRRGHTPSFCDESLFGAKPEGPACAAPWMRKEDVAKLHPLLWSPPPAPRHQPSLCPHSGETPLRAVHPRDPPPPATAVFGAGRKGESDVWKRPKSDSCSKGRGAPGRGRSQSLSQLNTPSEGFRLTSDNLKRERCKNQSPATPQGPLMRGRSKSVSGPALARSSTAVGGCKARPPWK
ncbi:RITA1 protein, partial [Sagittarius serpentarius]|nr:RITA1 protein [Sagittarius serpentarius]